MDFSLATYLEEVEKPFFTFFNTGVFIIGISQRKGSLKYGSS